MFKKIASNTISQVLSKVATAFISIFLISVLTNYLTVEMYGLYGKIYNYTGIFVFLADLGLYAITVREITNNKDQSEKIIGNVMSLRLILGIAILFFSVGLAYFLPGYDSDLALISIAVVSIFTIIQLLNSSILSLMQANMKIEFSLLSTVFGKLINVGLVCLIVFGLYNTQSLADYFTPFILIMSAAVVGVAVNTIMNYLYAKRISQISFRFDLSYIRHLIKISLPYGIALFLSIVYFKVDIIILSLIEGPKMGDISIALYSLPMKIVEVLMVVGGFYLNSILPSVTRFFEEKKTRELQELLSISFKVLFGFASAVFVCGILFAENIIEIIANKNYLITDHMYNSVDAFFVVFLVIIFYFISLIFIYVLVAAKDQSKLLKINIFVTIFNIIGNILLIPKYSFMGAAVVTLMSQVILMCCTYIAMQKIVKITFPILYIFKVIILGILIYFIGYSVVNNISLGLYGDVFIYGGMLFMLYLGILYLDIKQVKNIL